jgi:hypothetical protein
VIGLAVLLAMGVVVGVMLKAPWETPRVIVDASGSNTSRPPHRSAETSPLFLSVKLNNSSSFDYGFIISNTSSANEVSNIIITFRLINIETKNQIVINELRIANLLPGDRKGPISFRENSPNWSEVTGNGKPMLGYAVIRADNYTNSVYVFFMNADRTWSEIVDPVRIEHARELWSIALTPQGSTETVKLKLVSYFPSSRRTVGYADESGSGSGSGSGSAPGQSKAQEGAVQGTQDAGTEGNLEDIYQFKIGDNCNSDFAVLTLTRDGWKPYHGRRPEPDPAFLPPCPPP